MNEKDDSFSWYFIFLKKKLTYKKNLFIIIIYDFIFCKCVEMLYKLYKYFHLINYHLTYQY